MTLKKVARGWGRRKVPGNIVLHIYEHPVLVDLFQEIGTMVHLQSRNNRRYIVIRRDGVPGIRSIVCDFEFQIAHAGV